MMAESPRLEGFYWVALGQNPPEIAYWERGEWWLAGDARPWQAAALSVPRSERGPNPAQTHPSAKTMFSLDQQPQLWEARFV